MPYADPVKERSAVIERGKTVRARNRAYVDAHLQSNSCCVCGETDVDVLEFHHVNPGSVSRRNWKSNNSSLKVVQAEIDKCVVLCANCHVRVHKLASQMGIIY